MRVQGTTHYRLDPVNEQFFLRSEAMRPFAKLHWTFVVICKAAEIHDHSNDDNDNAQFLSPYVIILGRIACIVYTLCLKKTRH